MAKRTRLDVREDTSLLVEQMGTMVINDNRQRMHPIEGKNMGNPKLCILDSEVASGKTHGLINLINRHCDSSITFVEQTHTAESIANKSKAIAITFKDVRRVRDEELKMVNETVLEHLRHRVLEGDKHFVLTHSSLESILKDNGYQAFLYQFEGIFIDELFQSYHLGAYKWNKLKQLYTEFSLDVEHKDGNAIASFIASINTIIKDADADEITLLDMDWLVGADFEAIELELIETIQRGKQGGIPQQIAKSPALNLVRQLMNGNNHIYYLQKAGNYNNLVATKSYLPEHSSCFVCSDNAMKDSSMKAMSIYTEAVGVDVEEEIITRGDWSTHHIHWQIATSNGEQAINEFKESPQDFLTKMDTFDKGLFVLPKEISLRIDSAIDEVQETDADDVRIQKERWNKQKKADDIAGSTKHDLTSWGRHKGTSLYSDNDTVYIPTLFHKPKHATSAGWVAVSCKDGREFNQNEYDEQELELKGIYADAKNLIGRVKRTEDSIGDRVDIYICFPNEHTADTLKALFSEDMSECQIDDEENHWWKEPKTAELDKLLSELIVNMADSEDVVLSKLVDDGKLFRNMRHRDSEQWNYLRSAANKQGYHIHQPDKKAHWRLTTLEHV